MVVAEHEDRSSSNWAVCIYVCVCISATADLAVIPSYAIYIYEREKLFMFTSP